jgi:hypothetical protein
MGIEICPYSNGYFYAIISQVTFLRITKKLPVFCVKKYPWKPTWRKKIALLVLAKRFFCFMTTHFQHRKVQDFESINSKKNP